MLQPTLSTNYRYLDSNKFFSNSNGAIKVIRGNVRESTILVVSVKLGSVGVYLGEFSGDQPGCPDFHFGQTNAPVWVPLPCGVNTVTCVATGQQTTTAAIHLMEVL